MGLREQAALDGRAILEDLSGFGAAITLTSPEGVTSELVGTTADVALTIDPETGQAVTGRRTSVAVSMLSLAAMPAAVADRTRRPWLVTFTDQHGVPGTWKVADVQPDRSLAVVVLILEAYASTD